MGIYVSEIVEVHVTLDEFNIEEIVNYVCDYGGMPSDLREQLAEEFHVRIGKEGNMMDQMKTDHLSKVSDKYTLEEIEAALPEFR